jgi:hypothetical protein
MLMQIADWPSRLGLGSDAAEGRSWLRLTCVGLHWIGHTGKGAIVPATEGQVGRKSIFIAHSCAEHEREMISQRTKGAPSSPSLPLPHQPEDPCLCKCRLRKTAVCAGVGMPSSSPRRCIRPDSQGSSSRWDGYRIIARRENGVVHLWSRTGRNWAKDFPHSAHLTDLRSRSWMW